MNIGRIINLLRVAEGLDQGQLAKELGISRAYLSQVENGHSDPGLGLLKKVAKFFEIPLAVLLPVEDKDSTELYTELRELLGHILSAKILAKKD